MVNCTKIHVFVCGVGWFFAAVILYIVTAGLVFAFRSDWIGIEKVGAIIGMIPSIGGVYIVFIKCPKKFYFFTGLATLFSSSFSFIGALLILIGTTQNYHISQPHHKLVTYLTAGFMLLVSLATFLSLACCLGAIFTSREELEETPPLGKYSEESEKRPLLTN